ncbi:MAG TPA: hypothetical protein VGG98_06070 [Solirubrobacteraceae bacterium]
MIAEGTETPGGESGGASSGGRGSEGDLLAERRARRAAEMGDAGLIRRAETAEVTVQALETHLASLRQRLGEAESERRRISQLADAERASLAEREHELRRVKQREYAEQQLRVEAEDRRIELERESRTRIDRLNVALLASQRETRELADRLEGVQRELAETEQTAAAERSAMLADLRAVTERGLQSRIAALEDRAEDLRRGLESERGARERAERLLEDTRRGHRRMETLLGELKGVVLRLRDAATEDLARARERDPSSSLPTPPPSAATLRPVAALGEEDARRGEMAEALAAAVERLRARVASVDDDAPVPAEAQDERGLAPPREPVPASIARQPHKHSMSLLTRLRLRRKHRHERRSAAARRPTMRD